MISNGNIFTFPMMQYTTDPSDLRWTEYNFNWITRNVYKGDSLGNIRRVFPARDPALGGNLLASFSTFCNAQYTDSVTNRYYHKYLADLIGYDSPGEDHVGDGYMSYGAYIKLHNTSLGKAYDYFEGGVTSEDTSRYITMNGADKRAYQPTERKRTERWVVTDKYYNPDWREDWGPKSPASGSYQKYYRGELYHCGRYGGSSMTITKAFGYFICIFPKTAKAWIDSWAASGYFGMMWLCGSHAVTAEELSDRKFSDYMCPIDPYYKSMYHPVDYDPRWHTGYPVDVRVIATMPVAGCVNPDDDGNYCAAIITSKVDDTVTNLSIVPDGNNDPLRWISQPYLRNGCGMNFYLLGMGAEYYGTINP